MSEKYKIKRPEGIYFVTFTITDWIDIFIRPVYRHIIIDSLTYCQENKNLLIHAYVIMSSHLHAIFSVDGKIELQDIIRDFKKHTSKEIVKAIQEYPESRREWVLSGFENAARRIKRGKYNKVWQDGFHPVELDNNMIIEQRLNYIHQNPVEEEIVFRAEDYKYSSAIDYSGGKGVLSIIKLE